MISAIVIDEWKLKIYEKYLKNAGFKWTRHPAFINNILLLKVLCESAAALEPTIEAAQLARVHLRRD